MYDEFNLSNMVNHLLFYVLISKRKLISVSIFFPNFRVKVAANYIRLNVEKGKGVFQYDVKFNPDVDSTNIRCQLMKNVTHIIGETKSFDGSLLYLPVKLPEEVIFIFLFYFYLKNIRDFMQGWFGFVV